VTDVSALGGAILAAGSGSRLRGDGWTMPKPMVPVAGVPLVEHVIRNFMAAGVTSLVIIVNEEARECARWVRQRFPGLDLRFLVRTTASSLESFQEIARHSVGRRTLVSTVDAWCPAEDFVRFAEAARSYPESATVLAVTPFVADERPLWVETDDAGRVTRLGGESGAFVTAGIYLVPEHVRRMAVPPELGRLREFLSWLVARGEAVYGMPIPTVIDVDRMSDVALAEALARGGPGLGAAPPGTPR
jgi:NDP-sugar pyrophosphorylase family protein